MTVLSVKGRKGPGALFKIEDAVFGHDRQPYTGLEGRFDERSMAHYVPTRLARRLETGDAVVIGLGSMIGAGVFAAFGPAARAAGNGLLVGLAIAGLVAYCNA